MAPNKSAPMDRLRRLFRARQGHIEHSHVFKASFAFEFDQSPVTEYVPICKCLDNFSKNIANGNLSYSGLLLAIVKSELASTLPSRHVRSQGGPGGPETTPPPNPIPLKVLMIKVVCRMHYARTAH